MYKIILIFVCFLSLMLLSAPSVYSYGTAEGTTITNAQDQGTAGDPDVAGDSILKYANPLDVTNYATSGNITTSTVAAGYDMSIIPTLSDNSGYASANVDYSYSITNRGNISDNIKIVVVESNSSGTFTGTIYSILTNGETVAGPLANPTWTTPSLAADASIDYTIRVTIPATAVDGNWNVYGTTNLDQNGAGTGDSWPGTLAIAPATSDTANARDTQNDFVKTTLEGPVLILTKSVDITQVKPYEVLLYSSTYSNSGSTLATNVFLVDYIPQNVRYVTNSAENNNTPHAGSATVEYYRIAETSWTNSDYDAPSTVTNISKVKWTLSANVNSNNKGVLRYKVLVE